MIYLYDFSAIVTSSCHWILQSINKTPETSFFNNVILKDDSNKNTQSLQKYEPTIFQNKNDNKWINLLLRNLL